MSELNNKENTEIAFCSWRTQKLHSVHREHRNCVLSCIPPSFGLQAKLLGSETKMLTKILQKHFPVNCIVYNPNHFEGNATKYNFELCWQHCLFFVLRFGFFSCILEAIPKNRELKKWNSVFLVKDMHCRQVLIFLL